MAVVVGPLHSSDARGSVGSLTYSAWRGRSTVKARTGPLVPDTGRRLAALLPAAAATAAWKSMSQTLRDAWIEYAAAHSDIDWTGNPKRLTGYNWFLRCAVRSQLVGHAIQLLPPAFPMDMIFDEISHTWDVNGLRLWWYMQYWDGPETLYVDIWGLKNHSPGAKPSIKLCTRIGSAEASNPWFPIPAAGPGTHTFFLRFLHSVGLDTPFIKYTCTVG